MANKHAGEDEIIFIGRRNLKSPTANKKPKANVAEKKTLRFTVDIYNMDIGDKKIPNLDLTVRDWASPDAHNKSIAPTMSDVVLTLDTENPELHGRVRVVSKVFLKPGDVDAKLEVI